MTARPPWGFKVLFAVMKLITVKESPFLQTAGKTYLLFEEKK